jgi:hypothetical protein
MKQKCGDWKKTSNADSKTTSLMADIGISTVVFVF